MHPWLIKHHAHRSPQRILFKKTRVSRKKEALHFTQPKFFEMYTFCTHLVSKQSPRSLTGIERHPALEHSGLAVLERKPVKREKQQNSLQLKNPLRGLSIFRERIATETLEAEFLAWCYYIPYKIL